MGYLYRLDFASGKSYIGITIEKTLKRRLWNHRAVSAVGSAAVYRAWRRYGEPRAVLLAKASGAFLLELEQRAVRAYGTYGPGGYNMTPGGEVNPTSLAEVRKKLSLAQKGKKASAETRAKMSASHKGKKRPPRSLEHRRNLSLARIGKTASASTIEKMRRASTGRTWSAETRRKCIASLTGRKHSAETRAKLAAIKRGGKASPETRARMSAAHAGHPVSDETRAKQSIAGTRRYERLRAAQLAPFCVVSP